MKNIEFITHNIYDPSIIFAADKNELNILNI